MMESAKENVPLHALRDDFQYVCVDFYEKIFDQETTEINAKKDALLSSTQIYGDALL